MKKLYIEIKNILKENIKIITIFLILFIICTIELPFYIDKTGGIIDISSRIEIEDNFKLAGSLNMTYVSSLKGTIPSLIISLFTPNWDIIEKDEELGNETEDEVYFRNKLSLDESINNAIIVAYNKANKKIQIIDQKLYVTHVYEEATTDLKIRDQIISINDIEAISKKEINTYINSLKKDEEINIKVLNNDKEYIRKAKILEIENIKLIGILVNTDYNIKIKPELKFKFNKSESGPSGGLMMSLAIYSELMKEDITKGRKIAGTGTIDENGNVGSIDGIKYKLAGAVKNDVDIFIVPNGKNYKEALKEKNKNKYNIKIIGVDTFDDALGYLKN